MYHNQPFRIFTLLLLTVALALSGCSALIEPVTKSGTAPTPIVGYELGGVDNPDVFVDPVTFRPALLKALAARDSAKLQMWMTEPFLTGGWRADLSDTPPADAIKELVASYLGANNKLAVVEGADLKALMGGIDPLSIPRGDAMVVDAFLVSGWGQDGLDEAVLFISRMADNSIKWHGYMVIKGGFSGARLGGAQPYQNDAFGYRLYMPKGYTISAPAENEITIFGPQVEGAGHPGFAYIQVEPANGRTSEQIANETVEKTLAELGNGMHTAVTTVMGIDDAQAYVVTNMPGQDLNRQLFMVHGDKLYRIMFSPEYPQAGVSYRQMEDLYAMITNTFHFTE